MHLPPLHDSRGGKLFLYYGFIGPLFFKKLTMILSETLLSNNRYQSLFTHHQKCHINHHHIQGTIALHFLQTIFYRSAGNCLVLLFQSLDNQLYNDLAVINIQPNFVTLKIRNFNGNFQDLCKILFSGIFELHIKCLG